MSERKLKNLIAIVFYRWRFIVVVSLIVACLLGVYQFYSTNKQKNDPYNSASAIEKRYENAIISYDEKVFEIDTEIEEEEKKLDKATEYLENSLMMNVDPHNVYVSIMDLAVVIDDEKALYTDLSTSTVPYEYMQMHVQYQYLGSFGSNGLKDLPQLQALYGEKEAKYWNEVISLSTKAGGMLEIRCIGGSEIDAKRMLDAVYEFLCFMTDTINETGFKHSLVPVITVNRTEVNIELEEKIEDLKKISEETPVQIEKLEMQKSSIPVPAKDSVITEKTVLRSTLKGVIIGLVIGCLLGAVIIILSALYNQQIIATDEIIDLLKMPYLGALKLGKVGMVKTPRSLPNCIAKESSWLNNEEADSYIVKSTEAIFEGKKIVISSSIDLSANDAVIQELSEKFKSDGWTVELEFDALHNPSFLIKAREADAVCLIEVPAKSTFSSLGRIKEYCHQIGKEKVGFIWAR